MSRHPYRDSRSSARSVAVRQPVNHMVRVVLAFVLIAAATLFAATQANAKPKPEGFADLAERLLPAVVSIATTQAPSAESPPEGFSVPPGSPFEEFFKEFFDRKRPQQRQRPSSLGSGFIVDVEGYVVTNNHVIADAQEITVVLDDGTALKAELVGRDPETDLAVLKIDPTGHKLTAVEFGDSDKARIGEWVIAIGNPFGLGSTVTSGIISARGRDINAGRYDDFIQTDAPINKGNSGGPLFDMDGKVIGINTLIYSPSGGSVGIGFSVPSVVAAPIVRQLKDGGRIRRGWLGVRIQTVTEEIAESLDLDEAYGALVASVAEGSPAAKAGIKARDVILEFNGRRVDEMRKLPRIVAETPVDESVNAVVWRNGKRTKLKVTVGELTEENLASSQPTPDDKPKELAVTALGVTVATLSKEMRERFELGDAAVGVLVVGVEPDGPAAEKGVREGDLIVEVGQEEVKVPEDVKQRVREARKDGRKSVLLLVEGQGGLRFVAVRLVG